MDQLTESFMEVATPPSNTSDSSFIGSLGGARAGPRGGAPEPGGSLLDASALGGAKAAPRAGSPPLGLFDADALDRGAVRAQLLRHGYLALRCADCAPFDELEANSVALFAQPAAIKAAYDSLASMAESDPRRNDEQAMLINSMSSATGFSLPLWCTGYASLTEREQFHIIADQRALDTMSWGGACDSKSKDSSLSGLSGLPSSSAGAGAGAVPGLRAAAEAVIDALSSACRKVLLAVDPALERLRADKAAARGDPSVLDLFRYRGGGDDTTADNACFGMHSHVDPGLLTAKYVGRQQVAGLQVRDRATKMFVSEAAFAGCILLFANEQLEEWCLADCERPRIKAAEHRVIGTSLPRLSLVYELRSPPLELWSSVEDWSIDWSVAAKQEAIAERQVIAERQAARERSSQLFSGV